MSDVSLVRSAYISSGKKMIPGIVYGHTTGGTDMGQVKYLVWVHQG